MNLKKVTQTAILIALVAVTTMVVNIPLPGVRGYVNVGDTVVLLAGLLLGPSVGASAGALGSSLADLLLGYVHWAPWTLLIKGLEGFLAGWLFYKWRRGAAVSTFCAATVMVSGYFLVGILYYGFGVAIISLPGDLLQGGASVLLSLLLVNPLRKYLNLD